MLRNRVTRLLLTPKLTLIRGRTRSIPLANSLSRPGWRYRCQAPGPRTYPEGISLEQAVDEAIARIKQILSE